ILAGAELYSLHSVIPDGDPAVPVNSTVADVVPLPGGGALVLDVQLVATALAVDGELGGAEAIQAVRAVADVDGVRQRSRIHLQKRTRTAGDVDRAGPQGIAAGRLEAKFFHHAAEEGDRAMNGQAEDGILGLDVAVRDGVQAAEGVVLVVGGHDI